MKKALSDFCAFLLSDGTDDICFACHVSPDGDTLGSAFALARLCRARGRRVFVHIPGEIPETLTFLCEDFDNTPFEPRVVVAVDVSTPDRLGANFPYADRVGAVIDHHENNTILSPVRFVVPSAAATGLLVEAVFCEIGDQMTPAVLEALYTAISTDTGRFCHTNTTEEVFSAVARLASAYPAGQFGELNRRIFVEKSSEKLRLEGYILTHAHLHRDEGVVFFNLSRRLKRRFGLTDSSDLSSLVDLLRSFSGYSICALSKEQKEKGVYKLSVRSEGSPSASQICAVFGGGGHQKAAGCTIHAKNGSKVEKLFLDALKSRKNS